MLQQRPRPDLAGQREIRRVEIAPAATRAAPRAGRHSRRDRRRDARGRPCAVASSRAVLPQRRARMKSSAARAESSQSSRPKTRAACAMPAIISAFQRGEDLVVAARAHALLARARTACARADSSSACLSSRRRARSTRPGRATTQVPARGPRSWAAGRGRSAARPPRIPPALSSARTSSARPDVELAFLALGVGVERRVVAALRRLHLAHHPAPRSPRSTRAKSGSRVTRPGIGVAGAAAARCRRASSRSAGSPSRSSTL